jgi:uncharacterized protein
MIEVPKYIYMKIFENKISEITNFSILMELKKGNFIVPKYENEIETLYRKRNDIIESSTMIGLQILPTLKCNFRCIYCYENLNNSDEFMAKEVMDAIIENFKKTMKSTTRYLYISWYGGEPLLATEQISYLSNLFIDICDENNIQYFSHITTNGYLLNRQNVDLLIKLRIKSLQITIDGPENIHNSRRMLKNGGGTYKKILSNLEYAISQNLDIAIRINIDKTNAHGIEDLLLELKEMEILRDNVRISFGVVQNIGNACKSVEDTLFTKDQATNILRKYNILKSFMTNIDQIQRPIPHLIGCAAQTKASLIIGPSGEIYKCSKTIGNKKEICGTIFNIDYTHPNFEKWTKEDRLTIQQCQKCSLVPICDGNGCPYDFLMEKKEKNICNQRKRHKNYLENLKILYKHKSHGS